MASWVQSVGGEVIYLRVDSEGRADSAQILEIKDRRPDLVSVLWVNNETGVISPVQELVVAARSVGARIHIDAAQAWGKLPIDLAVLGADYVTFSAHKIGALAGSGVLWVGRGCPIDAVILGKHEKGRRAGTENLLGIYAAGIAAKHLAPEAWAQTVAPLRDALEHAISDRVSGTQINGGRALRVANTSNFNFEGVAGEGLVMALDLAGYSVSSGSACSSGVLEPSHVLMALGRSRFEAMAAIRVSLPGPVEMAVLNGFVEAVEKTVRRIREVKPFESKEHVTAKL
jgi:cysteine desulfurase